MSKTTPLIRARFAPSPTGHLHLGGARTALFNWLFARQNGGAFVLRFEDTDTARSKQEYVDAIRQDLQWLGLQWDEEAKQSDNADKHRQAAKTLLESGAAYQCYCTPEQLADMRKQQLSRGESPRYDRRWRDATCKPPPDIKPALRLKTPLDGESVFIDAVKGEMRAARAELDDFVILRADGAPTYNLANVVDDISGNITHVIRGDDHLINTHRQLQLFAALGKPPPVFAHMPMIMMALNKEDDPLAEQAGGVVYARMSKRAIGAGISELRANGYLPSAVVNYLARLSWAAGDAEMFDMRFLLDKFSLAAISPSPARHNPEKLKWLNREHLRKLPPEQAAMMATKYAAANTPKDEKRITISPAAAALTLPRAETLADIINQTHFFRTRPQKEDIDKLLTQHPPPPAFATLTDALADLPEKDWTAAAIKEIIQTTAKVANLKFPALAMPLRIILTGTTQSPDIAKTAALLTKPETLARLATTAL
ncbi:MAG: glutamate--tRNA ligase [Gammaproteobacteria bacterium]